MPGEGPSVADTLGAGASPLPLSAPGVLAPWMLAVLVRKCPAQPEAARSWACQAGEAPVDIMFLPRNGEIGNVPGQGTGLWGKLTPGNIHSPSCGALNLAGPAGPCGEKTRHRRRQACVGPWCIYAHPCRIYTVPHVHK